MRSPPLAEGTFTVCELQREGRTITEMWRGEGPVSASGYADGSSRGCSLQSIEGRIIGHALLGSAEYADANPPYDCGELINPDGLRNQIEGGIVQAASWTLLEVVDFDRTRITSADWEIYPILRMTDAPEVNVHLIERSGEPYLGIGEAEQGPASGAIANAVANATGQRIRALPLTAFSR